MKPEIPSPLPKVRPTPPIRAGGFSSRELLFRLAVVGLLLMSVILLWGSFNRVLSPLLKQSRELRSTASHLSAEVDDLDRKWTKADIEEIHRKFALVPSRLLVEQAVIDAWLVNLKEQAAPLALDVKASAGQTIAQVTGSNQVPSISVEISPLPATREAQSSYRRLLELTQLVAARDKRAHLTELTVEAGTNSIGHARLGYNFWAGEEAQP